VSETPAAISKRKIKKEKAPGTQMGRRNNRWFSTIKWKKKKHKRPQENWKKKIKGQRRKKDIDRIRKEQGKERNLNFRKFGK